jgi:CAAX prenyl protease-like protein
MNAIPCPEVRWAGVDRSGSRFGRRDQFILIVISALLAVELLGLSLRFDAQSILTAGPTVKASAGDPRAWMIWLVGHAGFALKAGIVAASAAVVFRGRRLYQDLSQLGDSSFARWSWPAFLGHLASYAAFVWVSGRLLEGDAGSGPWATAWFAFWLSLGLTVVASLLATAIPIGMLVPVAAIFTRALAIGGGVGATAVAGGQLANLLWRPLGYGTLRCAYGLLGVLVPDPLYRPVESILGTKSFSVRIAPECSGYEGIGLVLSFLGIYLWFFRDRFRLSRVWLLLPLGAMTIWLANVVRIVALVLVGTYISADVAHGGFHSQAGWIAFNLVTLGLIALASRCSFFTHGDVAPAVYPETRNPEAVHLAPLMSIVFAAMIGGAFSAGGLDRFYPIRLLAVAIPLWLYRREYASMRWSISWQAVAIGVLVFGLWVARWPGGLETQGLSGESAVGTTGLFTILWLSARVVGSVFTVPLAEELAFRGFLSRRLIATNFESVPPGRVTRIWFMGSTLALGILNGRW